MVDDDGLTPLETLSDIVADCDIALDMEEVDAFHMLKVALFQIQRLADFLYEKESK